MAIGTGREGFAARHVPITGWIRRYQWGKWLTVDVIAGISVAALLIPESLGDADIAGLPPEVGLYAAPLALLGYAIFGRSTILVVACSSSTGLVEELRGRGVDVLLARVHESVLERLRTGGVLEKLGEHAVFSRIQDAVAGHG